METQKSFKSMQIEKDGILYTVAQNEFEPKDMFIQRMWYVAAQQPRTVSEYQTAVTESNIWSNMHYLKCSYHPDDQARISSLAHKMLAEWRLIVCTLKKKPFFAL